MYNIFFIKTITVIQARLIICKENLNYSLIKLHTIKK